MAHLRSDRMELAQRRVRNLSKAVRETIARAVKQGASDEDLAASIKVSVDGFREMRQVMGLRKPFGRQTQGMPRDADEREKLFRELVGQGLTDAEIGDRWGVSARHIAKMRVELGIVRALGRPRLDGASGLDDRDEEPGLGSGYQELSALHIVDLTQSGGRFLDMPADVLRAEAAKDRGSFGGFVGSWGR